MLTMYIYGLTKVTLMYIKKIYISELQYPTT